MITKLAGFYERNHGGNRFSHNCCRKFDRCRMVEAVCERAATRCLTFRMMDAQSGHPRRTAPEQARNFVLQRPCSVKAAGLPLLRLRLAPAPLGPRVFVSLGAPLLQFNIILSKLITLLNTKGNSFS